MKRLVFLAGMMSACWWSSCEPPPDTWEPVDAGSEYCPAYAAGCCNRPAHCGEDRARWICNPSGACIPLCETSADCDRGERCEDAVCRTAPCGNDDECGEDLQCLGGSCQAAPLPADVDSCIVLPAAALVREGATRSFSVVSRDAFGNTLPHKDEIRWSVDQPDRGAITDGVLTGGALSGTVTVQARIGSTACAPAIVLNFAAPAPGKTRVIVADLATQKPVPNVRVVFDGQAAVETTEGVIEFDAVGSPVDVHAFPADGDGASYAWVSAYGTTSNDILLFTRRSQAPARFTGTLSARSFDSLSDIRGSVHLALHGSSIAGNLFDADIASVLGDLVETELDTGREPVHVKLPEGMVLGLGERMFRGGNEVPFSIVSAAGARTLWALGGNAELSVITEAIGPSVSRGEFDPGDILPRLVPMLGRLQSGALPGVVAEADSTTSLDGPDGLSTLKLETLMRLHVEATLPDLPTYKTRALHDGTPITRPFDAAIVVGGAQYDSQGFVPLGLSAGVDVLPEGGPDGKVDPLERGSTEAGKVALRVAPLHSGMETSRHVFVALATSLNALHGDAPLHAFSGLVTFPGELSFNGGTPNEIRFGDTFLGVPDLPGITDRTLSAGSKVYGATFHRLSVGDTKRGEWLVYFAPGEDVQLTLPLPPDGLTDRFIADDQNRPRARLLSVRLNDPALTYDQVLEFGSDNLDDLSTRLDAFSVVEIAR